MGKVKYASFIQDVRGLVGDAVFQKNKAGNTIRERVVPVNPRSSSQVAVRSNLSVLSKAWSGLTDSQRSQWDTAAASAEWTQKNVFGDNFQLSGEQLYLKLNLVIQFLEESPIDVPPTKATFNAMSLGAITAAAGTPALTVAFNGTLASDTQFIVSASEQVSQGIMSSKSVSYRAIENTSGSSPINLLAAYNAKFGTLVAGRKIFIRLEVASDLTGEKVLVGEGSVIVGA